MKQPVLSVLIGMAFAAVLSTQVLSTQALAQDRDGGDITRDLNSGPPAVTPSAPAARTPEPEPETTTEPVEAEEPLDTATPEAEAPEILPPAAPPVPALTAAERRDLPFRIDLVEGAEIFPGRSGPDFDVYAVRREGRGLLMIYVGPQSQYPIYSGEEMTVGRRRSIVRTEDGRRLALEHMFQMGDGRQLHVWVSAARDEDRALADAISHTILPR